MGRSRPSRIPWLAAAPLWGLSAAATAAPTQPGELENPLRDSTECEACHLFLNPDDRRDEPHYMPMTWKATLMGNTARDPVFWAGVAIAHQDDPTHTVDCIRCHAPNAFLEGRGDIIAQSELTFEDEDGVNCHLCHRLVEDEDTPAGNAQYTLDDTPIDGEVPMRGPWTYTMEDEPRHRWQQDTYVGTARACGTCHDVTTVRERVDETGAGMGTPFNEQRTYSEWLRSAYAVPGDDFRSCQDCHMPAVEDATGCQSRSDAGEPHPTGGRRHDLVGANRDMLDILDEKYGSNGGGDISSGLFDMARDRMDEMLGQSATLQVEFPDEVDLAAGLTSLPVTVTNETGHKLPTGYSEGRVMWLEVTGSYAGDAVYSSGSWALDVGIVDDPQLRRYEAIAEDADDGAVFHLLRNNRWVVDSRIPPKGLRADPDTDPVGDRYTLGADNTWPNFDQVTYTFDPAMVEEVPGEPAEMSLRVRLMYWVNVPDYLAFLAAENQTNDAGETVMVDFAGINGSKPLVLAEQTTTVALLGLQPAPETTGSSGSGGSSGDTAGSGGATESGSGSAGSGSGTSDGASTSGGATGSSGDSADADDGAGSEGCSCRADARGRGPVHGLFLIGVVMGVSTTLRRQKRRGAS